MTIDKDPLQDYEEDQTNKDFNYEANHKDTFNILAEYSNGLGIARTQSLRATYKNKHCTLLAKMMFIVHVIPLILKLNFLSFF